MSAKAVLAKRRGGARAGGALLLALAAACAAAARGGGPEVDLTLLDGRALSGRLDAVSPQLRLVVGERVVELSWADLVSVAPRGASEPAPTSGGATNGLMRFALADGSQFVGRVSGSNGSDFRVSFGEGRECRLQLGGISSIVAEGASQAALDRRREAEREPSRVKDVVCVTKDAEVLVLRGAVRRVHEAGLTFAWNERNVELPWARLAAVLFAATAPRELTCRVVLRDGQVFAGRAVSCDDESLTIASTVFENLPLAWRRVARIDVRSERLRLLSDLTPSAYEFEPFFDVRWEYAVDRSLSGRPIRLGGREFARGVALHSRARLTYALNGEFAQFAATVGIDDAMAPRGRAAVRVLGDGQVLWESPDVRGGEAPRDVLVSVARVAELTLEVDFGEDLDLSDHVCFGFARLIR
ncbi:MAG: hypothetical protein CHACPFDD_00794 [Phycisphaerae bacterium]|nr:hypothetical protein [Phycisphaerae bacterium]